MGLEPDRQPRLLPGDHRQCPAGDGVQVVGVLHGRWDRGGRIAGIEDQRARARELVPQHVGVHLVLALFPTEEELQPQAGLVVLRVPDLAASEKPSGTLGVVRGIPGGDPSRDAHRGLSTDRATVVALDAELLERVVRDPPLFLLPVDADEIVLAVLSLGEGDGRLPHLGVAGRGLDDHRRLVGGATPRDDVDDACQAH